MKKHTKNQTPTNIEPDKSTKYSDLDTSYVSYENSPEAKDWLLADNTLIDGHREMSHEEVKLRI